MEMYNWQEIKERGDCSEYIKGLGIPVIRREKGGMVRFKFPPWRPGSDSEGFVAGKDGWYDHAKGEKGSVLDACARSEFNNDIWKAQEKLGRDYGLEPTSEKAKTKSRIAEVYNYCDEQGEVTYQVVRYEPKSFRQRRPDGQGGWIWNLEGVELILYKRASWIDADWVCLVGGEKDVNNLHSVEIPATTNAGGEGHWQEEYNKDFKNKSVVILPDNDEAGRKRSLKLSRQLLGTAREVRVLNLPGLQIKGDVSDWLAKKGNNKQKLLELIANTSPIRSVDELTSAPPSTKDEDDLSEAKKANKQPFSNYKIITQKTPTGERQAKQPLPMKRLIDSIFRRFWGFPCRIGSTLFDHDRDNDTIRYLETSTQLFSWIQEKSKSNVKWGKMEGAVSQEQLYASVSANARQYELISPAPFWPERSDVYHTFRGLPEPTKDHKYFNKLCSFFCPSTEEDALLIRAFIATPLYFEPMQSRPLWVIDSSAGQGVGKTTLPSMIATLYGGNDHESNEAFMFNQNDLDGIHADRSERRLITRSGRKKRMVIVDNVTGYFKCARLAQWVTQSSLSGLPPYGTGEETRPNDLTYVITSNSATLDRDLIVRSFQIVLDPPGGNAVKWAGTVHRYIMENRLNILADIKDIMDKGISDERMSEFKRMTRFEGWERNVLLPVIGSEENRSKVFKMIKHRRDLSDGELEDAETVRDMFRRNIKKAGFNPDSQCLWLQTKVLVEWAQEAISGFGGRSGRAVPHLLRNMVKGGMIPEMKNEPRFYPPHSKDRRRGMMWTGPENPSGKERPVHVLEFAGQQIQEEAF